MKDPVAVALGRLLRAGALRPRRSVVHPWTADWARSLALEAVTEAEAWWFRSTKCQAPLDELGGICGQWRWHRGPH